MVRLSFLRAQVAVMAFAASIAPLSLLGCMTSDGLNGDGTDLPKDSLSFIPISSRNSHFPIEIEGEYGFRHLDFNGKGEGVLLGNGYHLHIEKKAENVYGWSFNNETQGILLKRKTMSPIDSSGIYIVGSFSDDSLSFGAEELWLPQILSGHGKTWEAYGRRMTLVSSDTVLWLPNGFSPQQRVVDPYTGRLRVEAAVVSEEKQGVVTYYAFSESIGLVAYEQKIGETLLSAGTLELGMALYGGSTQIWP